MLAVEKQGMTRCEYKAREFSVGVYLNSARYNILKGIIRAHAKLADMCIVKNTLNTHETLAKMWYSVRELSVECQAELQKFEVEAHFASCGALLSGLRQIQSLVRWTKHVA